MEEKDNTEWMLDNGVIEDWEIEQEFNGEID